MDSDGIWKACARKVITNTASTTVEQSHWIPPIQSSTSFLPRPLTLFAEVAAGICGAFAALSTSSVPSDPTAGARFTSTSADSPPTAASVNGSTGRSVYSFMQILLEQPAVRANTPTPLGPPV